MPRRVAPGRHFGGRATVEGGYSNRGRDDSSLDPAILVFGQAQQCRAQRPFSDDFVPVTSLGRAQTHPNLHAADSCAETRTRLGGWRHPDDLTTQL
jgi:hypothetical protein